MTKYGSRKFILAAYACVSATALLALGMVDQDIWFKAVGTALGLYALGNVAQKATAKE